MKKITKTSLLAIGTALLTQALQAQINPNDLIAGFTSQASGVTSDYLLDLNTYLGSSPLGQNTTVTLSGQALTDFNSVFTAADLSGGLVNVGIVGESVGAEDDVITSTLGATAPFAPGNSPIGNAAQIVSSLTLGPVPVSGQGFTTAIAKDPSDPGTQVGGGFTTTLGSNPLSTIGNTESITLNLWEDTQVGRGNPAGWVSEGSVTFNLAPVPEPSTYALGLVGGSSILALVLRRKSKSFSHKA